MDTVRKTITTGAANDYVCGTMTVEGAPHLKDEHLPVFDCANRCGRIGKRYISEDGGLELLCVKSGDGGLAADGVLLLQKDTKQLPKTD